MEDFSWFTITTVDFKSPNFIKVCKGGISQFLSFLIHQDHKSCEMNNIIGLEYFVGPLVCDNDANTCKVRKLIVFALTKELQSKMQMEI